MCVINNNLLFNNFKNLINKSIKKCYYILTINCLRKIFQKH